MIRKCAFVLLVSSITVAASAQTLSSSVGDVAKTPADAGSTEQTSAIEDIVVTAIRLNDQSIGSGVLSNRTVLETPFSVSTFDESLVLNLNVRSLNQLLRFDPSVQLETGDSSFGDFVNIRGFEAGTQYAGLPNLVIDGGRINIANIERVQVFRGVNTLSEGAGASAQIGGTISLIPKKPLDRPHTELTLGFDLDSQLSGLADVSRRFADDRLGIRVNLFALNGAGTVDDFSRRVFAGTINADLRVTDTLVLNAEFGAVDDGVRGYRDNIGLREGSISRVPDAPRNSTQYGQPWSALNVQGNRFYVNANWQPSKDWSLDASYGEVDSRDDYLSTFGEVINDAGDLAVIGGQGLGFDRSINAGQITARGRIDTGPVEHRLTVAYGELDSTAGGGFRQVAASLSNIYRPVRTERPVILPDISFFTNEAKTRTLTVFDDLRLFDGKISVLAGGRRTIINNGSTVARATTPLAAINYFFSQQTTIYASFGKAIEPGGFADTNVLTTNAGEALPARQVRQIEIGGKAQVGQLFLTAAFFDLQRPLEYYRSNVGGTRTFAQAGRQVHRGIELRAEGTISPGLRIISGYTFIDAEVKDNGVPSQAGNEPFGVPRHRASVFVEYDVPPVSGLTVSSGVIGASRSFLDLDNARRVPAYAQWDAGTRYAFTIGTTQFVGRVTVENVTNSSHWLPNTYFGLALSSPRALKTSVTVGF